jgi:hypothetical protein
MVAARPKKFGDALEWLLDARVLRCACPVAGSVVIGIADRSG